MSASQCAVCGNADFDEQDGLFFCTECLTQSQDLRVHETEDFQSDHPFSISHEALKKPATTDQLTKEQILGRPWTIYEGYQYIIIAQAEALVELGASNDLKDIAYLVWANYLRRLGVAFCTQEKLLPDILMESKVGRQRELFRGSLNNPKNRKRRVCAFVQKRPDADIEYAEEELKDVIFSNEMCKSGTKGQRNRAKSIKSLSSCPEWMDMPKTITICYIGLMLINPEILPHDVIRWIYEGRIPYLSPTHVLPPDMVLSDGDKYLFNTYKLDAHQLRIEIGKILSYLSIPVGAIQPVCVKRLVSRFIDELALPGDLNLPCTRLAEMFPFHYWTSTTPHSYHKNEVLTLAYIITTLNMVMALDGTIESELSDVSRKLQSLIGPEPILFIYDEWKYLTCERFHRKFDSCREFGQQLHKSDLRHLDSLINCYNKIEKGSKRWNTNCLNKHLNITGRYTSEFYKGLCNPLDLALDRCHIGGIDSVNRTQANDSKALDRHRNSTLCHITDVEEFKKTWEKQVSSGGEAAEILLEHLKTRPKRFLHCQTKPGLGSLSSKDASLPSTPVCGTTQARPRPRSSSKVARSPSTPVWSGGPSVDGLLQQRTTVDSGPHSPPLLTSPSTNDCDPLSTPGGPERCRSPSSGVKESDELSSLKSSSSSEKDVSQNASVMWLIDLCGQLVDCPQSHMLKAVQGLQDCIHLKNSGQASDKLVVTRYGPMTPGRKYKAKQRKINKMK